MEQLAREQKQEIERLEASHAHQSRSTARVIRTQQVQLLVLSTARRFWFLQGVLIKCGNTAQTIVKQLIPNG